MFFVLIMIMRAGDGTAIDHVEFRDKENCEKARVAFMTMELDTWNRRNAVCVEKISSK